MKRLFAILLMAACLLTAAPLASLAAVEPVQVVAAEVATVNVNVATLKELQNLPGIGKVAAERIIAYRTENGPFTKVDDLTKVKGIGAKTLDKIRDLVAVE